jgi:hypothetical protein
MLLSCLRLIFFTFLFRITAPTFIIVDDANPSWSYTGTWNPRGPGLTCSGCVENPDPKQVFNQTYHDTSGQPEAATASITFKGISVFVYSILGQYNPAPVVQQYTFSLNGVDATPFNYSDPNTEGEYTYNTLILSMASLNPQQSTTLSVQLVSGNLLLDYIVYDDGLPGTFVFSPSMYMQLSAMFNTVSPSNTSSSTLVPSTLSSSATAHRASSVPVAAVAATASIIGVLLAFILYLLWRRRKRGHSFRSNRSQYLNQ